MAVNVRVDQSVIEFVTFAVPNVRIDQSVIEFVTFPFQPPVEYAIKITLRGVNRRPCEPEELQLSEVKPPSKVKRAV
jgi:hypothetical protein